jgi:hypothetical protein
VHSILRSVKKDHTDIQHKSFLFIFLFVGIYTKWVTKHPKVTIKPKLRNFVGQLAAHVGDVNRQI